ncbi:MAG TPA: helix-turn-helix domain-containing protein [Treponemataceae bacterium]|nr:helix-turn-helix domain-containing protein [Treponemataceae bacterium]
MKIAILQFSGITETENAIESALQDVKIRVKRVKSLSRLHIWAASGLFDAIVVGEATLDRYRMIPLRHLWEHHSAHALVIWADAEGSRLAVVVKALPAAELGPEWPNDRARKLSAVLGALRNVTVRAVSERDARASLAGALSKPVILPALPATRDGSLHRKARDILELLAREGDTGASVERIKDAIWPGDARDRKRDIQAYVSRLRRTLNRAFAGQYAIHRERNRYILRKLA